MNPNLERKISHEVVDINPSAAMVYPVFHRNPGLDYATSSLRQAHTTSLSVGRIGGNATSRMSLARRCLLTALIYGPRLWENPWTMPRLVLEPSSPNSAKPSKLLLVLVSRFNLHNPHLTS